MLCVLLPVAACGVAAQAQPLRVAVYNTGLSRGGPGLLLRDIVDGEDPQVAVAAEVILRVRPDILLHGPADAFGFGEFRGQGGMAILSRLPLDLDEARDFSTVLWRDLAEPDLPAHADGSPFPTAQAQAAMRLSSYGHWDVPVTLPDGRRIHLLASYSSPPVFDGPEDVNGRRNRDELRFWDQYLGGHPFTAAQGGTVRYSRAPYILLAGLNIDPNDGDGAAADLRRLLVRRLFRDPGPRSAGGVAAAARQAGINLRQAGDPARDTADWRDDPGPGNLRVDYVLPSPALTPRASGVFWPAPDQDQAALVERGQSLGTRHRLVWVDLE